MGLQETSFIMDGVRLLFGFLDKLVYSLIKWILFGIFDLANLTADSSVFNGVYQRLYIILGIFMAFKLSFSFFQYIIDPESMTGKSDKSLSKLFSRTFIMLAALVFLPSFLFGKTGLLVRAQNAFLPSLPKIIFGIDKVGGLNSKSVGNTDKAFTNSIDQSSDAISMTVLKGFFAPSPELDSVCKVDKPPEIKTLDDFSKYINYSCNRRGDIVIDIGIAHTGTKYYVYSYMWFISTVVGVLIVALLLGITLSIAKRIFKLLVLEIMAPIPIMSIMDPKGTKDGAFRKWVKSLISTFGDIFMKLGLVYMIIIFIQLIVNSSSKEGGFFALPKDSGFRGTYLTILLILGLIFFAKEAPKFIKESLGFKSDSGGLFDDVKSVGKAAGLVGGAAIGTAGVIGSTIGNVRAQHAANKAENDAWDNDPENKGKHRPRSYGLLHAARNVGAALSGAVGGTTAAAGALTKKDAGIKSVMKAQQERNQREFDRRRHGGTMLGGIGAAATTLFGGYTPIEADEVRWKKEEDQIKQRELVLKQRQDANSKDKTANELRIANKKRAEEKAKENTETIGSFTNTKTGQTVTGNWVAYNSALDAANHSESLRFKKFVNSATGRTINQEEFDSLSAAEKGDYRVHEYFDFNGQDIDMTEAQLISGKLLDANAEDYYHKAITGAKNAKGNDWDTAIFNKGKLFEQMTGNAMETELGELKKNMGISSNEIETEASKISKESASINDEKQRINKEREDFSAQRRKANSNRHIARKGGQ